MKKLICTILIFLCSFISKESKVYAQFTSGPVVMCDTSDFVWFCSSYLDIEPFPNIGYSDLKFSLYITTNHPQTLKIILTSPSGTSLILSEYNGAGGTNYTNTTFSADATIPITSGTAPFTGKWMPQGAAGFTVFSGENPHGIWHISVIDTACSLYTSTGAPNGWTNGYFSCTSIDVSYVPRITVYPAINVSICNGEIADLQSIGIATYGYFDFATNALGVFYTTTDSVGTYYASYNGSGIYDIYNYQINVTILPKPTLGPDKNIKICNGTANLNSLVQLTGLIKEWEFNGIPISDSAASSATQPGNYQLIATNSYGCKDTVNYNLIVDNNYNLGLDSNLTRCPNQSINITGLYNNSGVTFNWYFNNQVFNHPESVSQSGVYSLIATNNFGCRDTAKVTVSTIVSPLLGSDQSINICNGDSVDLTNKFDTTYITNSAWYLNQSQVPQPTYVYSTSNYTLIATFNTGCIDTASINIVLNQNNSLGANQTVSICANQTTNLNTNLQTTGNTVEWYLNSTLVTNPTNVSIPGDYLILVTDINGCKDSCLKTVNIKNTPSLGSDQNIDVCSNSYINLTSLYVTTGLTSIWKQGNTIIANPYNVNNNGTYTLIATSSDGCSDTANVQITQLQTVSLGNDISKSICDGSTINLNTLYITGINTTQWHSDTTLINDVSSIGSSGTYTIIATNSFGCSDTSNVILNVNPKPFIGNDTIINHCSYYAMNLTIIYNLPNSSCQWDFNGAPIPNPIHVNNGGNYNVIYNNSYGCKDSATITLNMVSPPSLGNDQTISICSDSSINLNLVIDTTNLSTIWLLNNLYVTNTSNVNQPGIYNLIAINSTGCKDTLHLNLTVNSIPNPGPSQNFNLCQGQSLNLNNSFNFGNDIAVWSNNGQVVIDATNIQDSGTYDLQLTNSNGCVASSSANVVLLPKPEIGPSTTLTNCLGTTSNLTSIYDLNGMSSSWEFNGSPISSPISANQAGNYQVIAIDQNGCSDTAQISLTYYTGPELGPDMYFSLCQWQTLDLSSLFSISGVTAQYLFNGIPISNYTAVNDSGQYQIIVTDINGCMDTMNVNYQIAQCRCSADFNYSTTCIDDPIEFEIIADSTILNAHWTFSQQGINDSYQINPTLLIPNPAEITITLNVQLSCGIDSIKKTISFENCFKKCKLFIPSAFTPNEDGLNDLFKTESYCKPEYFKMNILNRLGKVVFSSDDYNNTWDGKIDGVIQEEGIYVYLIEYKFPNQFRSTEKNTFTLTR